jgi:phage portal protein BeeE
MDTTTTDGGAQAQPQDSAAVTTEPGDMVITTDDNGAPTLQPVEETVTSSVEADATDEAVSQETQATVTDTKDSDESSVEEWAKSKGLPLDDPVKLAKMYRDAEKRMHEATEKARELETATVAQVPVDYTGDPGYDTLAQSVNTLLIQNNVRDFFSDNPEARNFESKMAEIVTQRPHLQNDLDALYALARTDPGREAELKQAGGREALTNLAQKQQQIPPTAGATNSGVYESQQISPQNVYELVDKNDQEWFEKNHAAISKAMSGK